jgi:lysylphosphatidylglycerol synthetase-like protein (DUF2156 family)
MESDKKRPILITIIAVLTFLGGLLALIAGIVLAAGIVSTSDLDPDIANLGTALWAALIVLGLIYIILAGGFWNGWKVMWYLGVIFSGIGLIFGIASFFFGTFVGIIPIIIDILILYYLFRPGVKEFFGI